MNKQSLDERIGLLWLFVDEMGHQTFNREVKAIFKDVIQEVLPEKTSKDIISIAYTGKPDDAKEDWTPQESLNLSKGFNHAIDTINSNVDSLLTGEKQ